MDLLWSLAKRNYSSDIPMPSEVWDGKNKIDRRSGEQIVKDIVKKFGGELDGAVFASGEAHP